MSKWGGMKCNQNGGMNGNKKGFTYVENNNKNVNQASKYTNTITKQTPLNIVNDYDDIIKNGCVYLPSFFGNIDDRTLFDQLKKEIDLNQMVNWSKHQKYENPQFSITFNKIIDMMAKHFNVKVIATRMNYYKDTTAFKPMHRDSHSTYMDENGEMQKENFTMGASFGYTRALDFIHDNSGAKFTFPQKNNDIFAFDTLVNDKFMHGVPKLNIGVVENSERISIIAWGKKLI